MQGFRSGSLYILCGALLVGTLWRGAYFPEPKWGFTFLLLIAAGWELTLAFMDGNRGGTLRSPALWLFLAFAVYATYSIFWTVTSGDTEREASLLLALAGIIFVARGNLVRTGRRALTAFGAWTVYAATFASAWGVITYLFRISPYALVVDDIYRAGSTFEYSNALACFGLMALPVTAALFRGGRPGERPWYGAAFTLQASAVILSFSRAGSVMLLLISCYVIIAARRERVALTLLFSAAGAVALALVAAVAQESGNGLPGTVVVCVLLGGIVLGQWLAVGSVKGKARPVVAESMLLVMLAAAAAAVYFSFRVERIRTIVSARFEEGFSYSRLLPHRLDTWSGSIEALKARPVTGSGLGTFYYVYQQYAIAAYTKFAHNLLLQTAVETGLVGAALLALFLGYAAVLGVWRLIARSNSLARAFAISVLVFLAYNMFDWEWYVPALTGWFMLAVACMEGVTVEGDGAASAEAGESGRVAS